ncbi:hypothetical protein EON65_48340, partial [archaeon]
MLDFHALCFVCVGKTTSTDPTRQSSAEKKGGSTLTSPSPYLSGKIRTSSRSGKRAIEGGSGGGGGMQSFVFNEDMRRIRIAEGIIMKVEAQFGIFSRDPDGRLAPLLQALTKKAAVELKKDDKRTITEPSHTVNNYAPYALKGGIGLAEVAWAPNIVANVQVDESKLVSKWVKERDESVNAKQRGAKSGGSLKAADTKGSSTRPRKPIKASISSRVDFNRYRSIQSLGERLEEIYKLKEQNLTLIRNAALTRAARIDENNKAIKDGSQNAFVKARDALGSTTPIYTAGGVISPKVDPALRKAIESAGSDVVKLDAN